MTREEAIENHRKMWNWIADKTEKRKRKVCPDEYFSENNLEYINNFYYCCMYIDSNKLTCKDCIIEWNYSDIRNYYTSINVNSIDYQYAAYYARKIANLPERKIK